MHLFDSSDFLDHPRAAQVRLATEMEKKIHPIRILPTLSTLHLAMAGPSPKAPAFLLVVE